MTAADRQRITWEELPPFVRAGVEDLLGSPVVSAQSQNAGFSPGSADRVVLADGRRAFVKTADPAVNTEAVELHLREARIVAALPAGLPAAYGRGFREVEGWAIAAYDDVEGRHPATPWRDDEIARVLAAFAAVAAQPIPPGLAALIPTVLDDFGPSMRREGWATMASAQRDALLSAHPWLGEALDGPLADQALFEADLVGDRLVHFDARADNILLRPDGSAVIVDWPWAAVGPDWIDPVQLLFNAAYFDPDFDPLPWIGDPSFGGASTQILSRFLLMLAGHFLMRGTLPEPPAVPGLRRFQSDQGHACLRLVRRLSP